MEFIFSSQALANVLQDAFIIALVGLAFRIPYSVTGFFNLGYAAVIVIGGYIGHWMLAELGFDILSSVLTAIVLCGSLSLATHAAIVEPSIKIGCERWQLLVISLGLFVLGHQAMALIWGNGIQVTDWWQYSTSSVSSVLNTPDSQIFTACFSALAFYLTSIYIKKSNIGQSILLIGENQSLAELFGINVRFISFFSVIIGGALCGFAGLLIYQDTGISPYLGFDWLLNGVVAMIIAGLGSLRFLLLGALVVSVSQNLVAFYFDSRWVEAITFLILMMLLIAKPEGFSNKKIRKIRV